MIHCIAIDDEPIALSIIREYAARYGGIELETFTSPSKGMERVCETHPDILFLDIEMNSCNGLELARRVPGDTMIVFTTAYAQYALEGFNVNAADFLHKPIFYDRFVQAMDKVLAWRGKGSADAGEAGAPSARKAITLKSEHKNIIVDIESILYIEAMENYVKVFRKGMPMVVSQITMKEMEASLPPEIFIRVHRSFIVSLNHIDSFSNRRISILGVDRPIPVGRTYNEAFQNVYNLLKAGN